MEYETIYDFINKLESIEIFYYSCIIVLSLFAFQFLNVSLTHIFAIILAIVIILYINKRHERNISARMDSIYLKLHMIQPRPKFFYMDSDIIELIDDIKEYRNYNMISYTKLIYALDNFLEIVSDMEIAVKDFKDNIEVALHQKQIAIDNLQSILFSLPIDRKVDYKLEQAIYNLSLMLQRHIDKMIHKLNKDIEINGYHTKTGMMYLDHPKTLEDHKNRKYYNYNY